MAIYHAQNKAKLSLGAKKVKQAYIGNKKVYSSGSTVTYVTDTGTSCTEEVDSGASCLSPKTFTPQKTGWSFVGWREDKTASSGVLGSKVMGDSPITLYAVFRQTITVTCYNGSTAASAATGYRYYNNGTVVNPSFTLSQAGLSGWTARGWSTGTAGNSGITYSNGASFTRDSNITLYGMYQQTITLSYNGNGASGGSTAAQSGTRYYNSNGATVNPSFTLRANGFSRSGCTFKKWAFGSTGGTQYAAGASVTLSASNAMYAVWYVAAQTIVSNKLVKSPYGCSDTNSHSNIAFYRADKDSGSSTGAREWGQLGGGYTSSGQYVDITYSPAVVCLGQTVTLDFGAERTNGSYFEGGLWAYIVVGGSSVQGTIDQAYYQQGDPTARITLQLPSDGVSRNIVVRLQVMRRWIPRCGVINLFVSASP